MEITLAPTHRDALAMPNAGPNPDPLIAAWLAQVAARSGSTRTPGEYEAHLRSLQDLLDGMGVALVAAQPAHLFAWAHAPLRNGKMPSASTVTVKLAAARSFFEFCRRVVKLRPDNPADDVTRPKAAAPVPRGLTAAELRRLLDVLPDTDGGRRDRAIIIACVMTGLRRTEVLGLTRAQLEDDGDIAYYVTRVKGGKERRRELPRPAVTAIGDYWQARGRSLDELPADERIFPVTGAGFAKNLARYGEKAGLTGLHPHALRHSSAKLRRESGASLEEVSAHLGHASIATTSRYLARLEGSRDTGWQGPAAALGLA